MYRSLIECPGLASLCCVVDGARCACRDLSFGTGDRLLGPSLQAAKLMPAARVLV